MKWGISSYPPNLDPNVYSGRAAGHVKVQVYSRLVKYWENLKIVPDPAESWEWQDDLTLAFHLRPGVKFHNGQVLTSEDVKFSIERILDREVAATSANLLGFIESVETPDDNTVIVHLSQPDALLLDAFAAMDSLIVSKEFVTGGGDLDEAMMGTGPFKVANIESGVKIELVRNDDYFLEGLPYLDGVEVIAFADPTSRVTALRSGAVDMIDYVPHQWFDTIRDNPELTLHGDTGTMMMSLAFKEGMAPFDNPKAREAIAWAIDRQAILDAAFFGQGAVVTGGPFFPDSLGYNPDLEGRYGYDPERVKELLAEAGITPGTKIDLLSNSTYEFHKTTAEIVQAMLMDVGLEVSLELPEWAAHVERRKASDFQVLLLAYDLSPDPDVTSGTFGTGGAANYMQFSNEGIDGLYEQGRRTLDREERQVIYSELDAMLLDLLPTAYLMRRADAEATAAYVKGYFHIPGTRYSAATLLEAWMEK